MITPHSKIRFHTLKTSSRANEKEEYTITRWDTDNTIIVTLDVINIIKALSSGLTVYDAAKKLGITTANVLSILQALKAVGYIKTIDGRELKDTDGHIHPWLESVPRQWFSWSISKPFLTICFLFILSGLAIGLYSGQYFPTYKHYFWTDDIFVVIISLQLLGFLLLLLHEMGHFIVTKAIGGEALMRFSHRYIYFIAETESYHIAEVPKEMRYLVYFAGMLVDFFIIALCYWLMLAADSNILPLGFLRTVLPAVILLNIQGIVWQYNAFLRTDMYNFLSDFLDHENLHANTVRYIARRMLSLEKLLNNQFPGFIRKAILGNPEIDDSDDLRILRKQEKKQVSIYSFVLVTGLLFISVQFIFFILPRELTFVSYAAQGLLTALQNFDILNVFKSLFVISMMVYQYFFVLFLVHKSKHSNGKQ